jgi:putative transposase
MQAERKQHLSAAPYQQTPEREAHANGYKPKTMQTRIGKITFDVPQVREGGFYPEALEKGLRSERALTLSLAEMYVQGVSTRKVKAITEQLCGTSVSSTQQVSNAAALLDTELEKWRNRPLGECPYLFLDAYYEQVREDGQVRDLAVLTAVGVNIVGKREILGVSVSLSEHEVHWRAFLESLKGRGLGGVQLGTSDDHAGLRAARLAVFGGIPWQRCQFHLQRTTPRRMYRTRTWRPKSLRTHLHLQQVQVSARSSMLPTAPRRIPTWPGRFKSTRRSLPAWQSGWPPPSRKA